MRIRPYRTVAVTPKQAERLTWAYAIRPYPTVAATPKQPATLIPILPSTFYILPSHATQYQLANLMK